MISIYFNEIKKTKIIIKNNFIYFIYNPLLNFYKYLFNKYLLKNNYNNNNNQNFKFYEYLNIYNEDFDDTSSPSHIDIITSIHDDSYISDYDDCVDDDVSYDFNE